MPNRKKNPTWIYVVTAIALMGAGLFFWMLTRHSGKSESAVSGPTDNDLAPQPTHFITPGAIIHWRAGEKMDAWVDTGGAHRLVRPDDLVVSWRNLIRDTGENALYLLENKQNFCPKYVKENARPLKIGVGLAHFEDGNAMLQRVDLKVPEAQGFPFGNYHAPKGLTLIMLARPNTTGKPTRIIRLGNQENKGYLDVSAFPNNDFTAVMKSVKAAATLKVATDNAPMFSVISVVWNGATNKALLSVRSADGVKHGPVESPAPKGCPVLNEIRIGESATSGAEARDFFHGEIAEIILWPFPMDVDERTLMEQNLCEFYFTTPGQRY